MPELKYVLYRPSSGGAWSLAVSEDALYPSAALPAGTYDVIAGDGVASQQVTVPALTASIAQTSANAGDTLTLETNASPARSVRWARDDTIIPGETTANYDTTGEAGGEIRVIVTDGVQTVASASVTLAVQGAILNALTLAASGIAENALPGAAVGAIEGRTSGSTLSLIDDAGGRFAISGGTLVRGATALDHETAASHDITIRETMAGAMNTPRDTTLTIAVTDVPEGSGSITINDAAFTPGTEGNELSLAVTTEEVLTGAVTVRIMTVDTGAADYAQDPADLTAPNLAPDYALELLTVTDDVADLNLSLAGLTAVSNAADGFHILVEQAGEVSNLFALTDNVTIDAAVPVWTTLFPGDGTTDFNGQDDLQITYSETVYAGSGSYSIRRASDNSEIEAIPIASCTISGGTVTIPQADIRSGVAYVIAPEGIVVDGSGNPSAAIAEPTTWSFTVGSGSLTDFFETGAAYPAGTEIPPFVGASGRPWEKTSGANVPQITADNRARATDTGFSAIRYAIAETANHYMEAVIRRGVFQRGPISAHVYARMQLANGKNGYAARYLTETGEWELIRRQNNGGTRLGFAWPDPTFDAEGQTRTVRVACSGTTIRMFIDGVERASGNDATYTQGCGGLAWPGEAFPGDGYEFISAQQGEL